VSQPVPPEPADLAKLARSVAAEAAELLASRHGRPAVVQTKSSPTDVVTEMDAAAEDLIRGRILAARPGDAVLGEERGQTGDDAVVRWIVDPLDGTVNYLYGLPSWAVSVAAEVAGVVVAGVVSAPLLGSLYTAHLGGGAWLESSWFTGTRQLACNNGTELAGALVATGFGYAAARRAAQGKVVARLLPLVRDIRRAGAAAVDLCCVASGQLDAFYERGLHEWDFAAGRLIACEAGAVVAGLHGSQAGESMTIAAGPGLFGGLHDALVELGAGSPDDGPLTG
jgi:myo-inositol-1(or 4)-monophosphatase